MQAFEKYRLRKAEKMLNLMASGKKKEILSQRNRTKTLDNLQKQRLIEVTNGRFNVTQQGKIALQLGIATYLETLEVKGKVIHFSLKKTRNKAGSTLKFLCFSLVLLIVVVYFTIFFF